MATTAYLFDKRFKQHETGMGHPERPERLVAIHEKLQKTNLYKKLYRIESRFATEEEIEMVHLPSYVQRVREEVERDIHFLDSMDTPVCRRSYDIARLAAGSGMAMCDAVLSGLAVCGFCNIRPPGHHAEIASAGGFCIFNNVAIAARYLQKTHKVERIAIVDWDVHHGNGTQHIFEEDSSVYFVSLHQSPHYPGTGSFREKGRGEGTGYTLNIPMGSGSGVKDYLREIRSKVIPALESFEPEIILISCGFDAHTLDPLSGIHLSSEAYYTLGKHITDVAKKCSQGRVIAFLEGGYNLNALADGSAYLIKSFLES